MIASRSFVLNLSKTIKFPQTRLPYNSFQFSAKEMHVKLGDIALLKACTPTDRIIIASSMLGGDDIQQVFVATDIAV